MTKIRGYNMERLIEHPIENYNTILVSSGAPWASYAYVTNLSKQQQQNFINAVKQATAKDVCYCECEIYYNREKIKIERWTGAIIKTLPEWWQGETYFEWIKPNQLVIELFNHGIRYDREPDCPNPRCGTDCFYGTTGALYNCIDYIEKGECPTPIANKFIGKLLFPEKYPDKSKRFNFTEQELNIPIEKIMLDKRLTDYVKKAYKAQTVKDLVETFNTRGYLCPEVLERLEHISKQK